MPTNKDKSSISFDITDFNGRIYKKELRGFDYANKINRSDAVAQSNNYTLGASSPIRVFDSLDYGSLNSTYGSYVLTPRNTFYGFVNCWGAGTGIYSGNGDSSGAGGHSKALIRFEQGRNYSIVVGERGLRDNVNSQSGGAAFGGGGRGHGGGSTGGGLSGIFVGTKNSWGRTWVTSGLAQANALLIAGGGGGGGHGGNSHHGTGGGGGGYHGWQGHNAGHGNQANGGGGGYSSGQSGYALHGGHSGNSSVCGGGGGGWFGGGGGGHTSSHHNGGGGGSGHVNHSGVMTEFPYNESRVNERLAYLLVSGETVPAPGGHDRRNNGSFPAGFYNPHRRGAGQGTNANNDGVTEGLVTITLAPDIQYKAHTQAFTYDMPGTTKNIYS
jgi:hypothetical protein